MRITTTKKADLDVMQIKLCTRTALDVFKANCMHYMMHMMGDVERVIELEGASERGRQPRENP